MPSQPEVESLYAGGTLRYYLRHHLRMPAAPYATICGIICVYLWTQVELE